MAKKSNSDLPFDGAISRFADNEAPKDIRELKGSQPGGKLHRLARQTVEALGIAHDHMRSAVPGDVQPEVLLRGQLQGQDVVVRGGLRVAEE